MCPGLKLQNPITESVCSLPMVCVHEVRTKSGRKVDRIQMFKKVDSLRPLKQLLRHMNKLTLYWRVSCAPSPLNFGLNRIGLHSVNITDDASSSFFICIDQWSLDKSWWKSMCLELDHELTSQMQVNFREGRYFTGRFCLVFQSLAGLFLSRDH